MHKCIVLEDEPLAMQMMEAYIANRIELVLAAKAMQLRELRDILQSTDASIIFLDMVVPDGGSGGFRLGQIPQGMTIVTTTALPKSTYVHEFEGRHFFEMTKPISPEKFNQCIDQVLRHQKYDHGSI
ncbi:Response regulator receiver domain-containing protein [bacterium A37T11]|nr:Response regulator receiver domain-containing protein [bacterium A37T11]